MRKDIFSLRLFLSSFIYLFFLIFFYLNGLYQAYLYSLILALPPSIYFQSQNQLNKNEFMKRLGFSSGSIVYFGFTLLIFPKNLVTLNIIFSKVFFEELFFRFSLLGIFSTDLDFENTPLKTYILIVINSIFFLALHKQYSDIFDLLLVFILGINYALCYVSLGVIPAFVSHMFWNLYSPNLLFQIPFFVGILGSIFLPKIMIRRRERSKRVSFLK